MKPIAWIGIGCGVIILIGVIVVLGAGIFVFDKASDFAEDFSENPAAFAAETIVRLNPELELVESDRESGKENLSQMAVSGTQHGADKERRSEDPARASRSQRD